MVKKDRYLVTKKILQYFSILPSAFCVDMSIRSLRFE